MSLRQNLESMLAAGQDNALLRFTLGNEYLKEGLAGTAVEHYSAAIEHDPAYTAAWKQLGKALEQNDEPGKALEAWLRGQKAAEKSGDVQAGKEMGVFARRLEKKLGDNPGKGD
jgi:Tfp pilus assembly protein PilF